MILARNVGLFHNIHRDKAPADLGLFQFSRRACLAKYRCFLAGSFESMKSV